MFVFVSATVYKEEFPEKPNLWYSHVRVSYFMECLCCKVVLVLFLNHNINSFI